MNLKRTGRGGEEFGKLGDPPKKNVVRGVTRIHCIHV